MPWTTTRADLNRDKVSLLVQDMQSQSVNDLTLTTRQLAIHLSHSFHRLPCASWFFSCPLAEEAMN